MTTNIYDMADTWNDGGTVFAAIKMNVTDTASDAASLLMDLQVGGTSQFSVDKAGTASANGIMPVNDNDRDCGISSSRWRDIWLSRDINWGANVGIRVTDATNGPIEIDGGFNGILTTGTGFSINGTGGMTFNNSGTLRTNNGHNFTFRPSGDALEILRDTNAQAFRIYNTYTDASNYERLGINTGASYKIGNEVAGTGSHRDIAIDTGNEFFIERRGSRIFRFNSAAFRPEGAQTLGTAAALFAGLFLTGLATSDPAVAGQVWNDAGTLKISAG